MIRVGVTTHPFSQSGDALAQLERVGFDVKQNPYERKMSEAELIEFIADCDYLLAGTETYTPAVLDTANKVKLIARIGIGLDGLNIPDIRDRGIRICYTPDAPTTAVAELTIGMMIDACRSIRIADQAIRKHQWKRKIGRLLAGQTIGIIGVGRIGKTVAHLLQPFRVRLIGHDIAPDLAVGSMLNIEYVTKDSLLTEADIISLHLPLKDDTRDFIGADELSRMKSNSLLINTARGGIVNEADLALALKNGQIAGAAVDVFADEPYKGPLTELENCTLTAHMGASTAETRRRMELEAIADLLRFHAQQPMQNEVVENG